MLRRVATAIMTSAIAIGLLSACTPEQIATYTRDYGQLSPTQKAEWLALPDAPIRTTGGDIIHLDGSVQKCSKEFVNSRPYSLGVAEPALQAFAEVARCRGWSQADIVAWTPFVTDVMAGESGFCPNPRRGARWANGGKNCAISRQGTYSDSGFGQLISIHHGPGRWLCVQEGICGANSVISTPWNSMVALVALVERSGSQPWCYNASARRYHKCHLAP